LIGKAIEAIVVTENEMVKQSDAQQFSSFPQSCGERPILRARRGISGRVIVDCNDRTSVEKDRRLKHFTRVDKAERECPDRDDVHADAGVLGIETTDQKLLAIKPGKAWSQCRGCRSGITKKPAGSSVTTLRHKRDTVPRNELWNGKSVDGLLGHGGTSCMLNKLALSQKPKRQGRTTEVTGRGLPKKHGRMRLSGGRDRSLLARTLHQPIRARQATGLTWPNNSDRPRMTMNARLSQSDGTWTECRNW